MFTVLHGDDTKLILFIDPDQESLCIIVVDTATLGPVTLHASGDQVLVSRHEQEVIVDQLLTVGLGHAEQWVVSSGEICLELLEGALHQVLDVQALGASDTGGKAESLDAAADTDPGRMNWGVVFDVAFDLVDVQV